MLGLIFSLCMVSLCFWQLNATGNEVDILWAMLLVVNAVTLGVNIVICGNEAR